MMDDILAKSESLPLPAAEPIECVCGDGKIRFWDVRTQ